GLEIAWAKEHKLIIVETDSKGALELIENPPLRHPSLSRTLRAIRRLIQRYWSVKVKHQLREANKVVDRLANLVLDTEETSLVLEHPPMDISFDLLADVCGTMFPRSL
ncbi:hypothetical protein PIB30_085489, partial [Stylosanthes scabra]|nr:hypothetical protein [Stylosanthes scabra]